MIIHGMSYNFEVLLGFYGWNQYPVKSVERIYKTEYNSKEAPVGLITKFLLGDDGTGSYMCRLPYPPNINTTIRGVIPYTIIVDKDVPPRYWLKFEILKWNPWVPDPKKPDEKVQIENWCEINQTTGTVTAIYREYEEDKWPDFLSCNGRVTLFQGEQGSVFIHSNIPDYDTERGRRF
jgi:hypothetical protein